VRDVRRAMKEAQRDVRDVMPTMQEIGRDVSSHKEATEAREHTQSSTRLQHTGVPIASSGHLPR